MSSPSPVTDGRHVWVMTGTGMLSAFDFAGNQAVDARRAAGLWPIRHHARLRGVPLAARRRPLRAGVARDDDRRPVLHPAHRHGHREDRVARRAADDARFESPDAYTTPALLKHAGGTEIVVTGGDVVTGHDPATGKELWRADGPQSHQRGQLPHRRVSRRARRSAVRAVARAAAAGAEARRARRRHQVARVVVVQQRPGRADPGHRRHLSLFHQRPRHDVLPRSRRPGRSSTGRNGSAAPPTAARRCWPTGRSTSPTRTA